MAADPKKVLDRHEKMKNAKRPWLRIYQLVGEYVFMKRQNFTRAMTPGVFLNANVFDGTAARCVQLSAAALQGGLWPSAKKAFKLCPPRLMPDELKNSKEVKDWYRRATANMVAALDNPHAGLTMAQSAYMLDQVAFGISGIMVEEGDSNTMPCTFKAVDTKKLTIAENSSGFVDTVYIEKEMTVRQVAQEYGIKALHRKMKLDLESDPEKSVVILHAIEPRLDTKGSFGDIDMPIASIHIDVENVHKLKEGGFVDMPIKVGRFSQAMGEVYGRSPGIESMPDVLEINAIREGLIAAMEIQLRPPIAVTHDGASGNGKIRTGAGDINVRMISGRIPDSAHKWIEPIFTIGDLKPCKERVQEIEQIIAQIFMLDRLLDLNNETRMTLGEANIRDRLRGQALAPIYSRQTSEVYTPLIERVFGILYGKGLLGMMPDSPKVLQMRQRGQKPFVIPQVLLDFANENGGEFYEIEYISPAARIVRSEEMMGINQLTTFLAELAKSGNLDVFDPIDMDKLVLRVVELTGAPEDVVRDTLSIKNLREAKAQAQAEAQKANIDHIKAQAARASAQAAESASKAGVAGSEQQQMPLQLAA